MRVVDLNGEGDIGTDEELLDRLRSVRKGKYGAFVLLHNDVGPLLFVHINNGHAYVHYFDDMTGANAGFQPTGMTPRECPETVRFVQTDGSEGTGSAIEMPDTTICSADVAYQAATEFLHHAAMPSCINWFAL